MLFSPTSSQKQLYHRFRFNVYFSNFVYLILHEASFEHSEFHLHLCIRYIAQFWPLVMTPTSKWRYTRSCSPTPDTTILDAFADVTSYFYRTGSISTFENLTFLFLILNVYLRPWVWKVGSAELTAVAPSKFKAAISRPSIIRTLNVRMMNSHWWRSVSFFLYK